MPPVSDTPASVITHESTLVDYRIEVRTELKITAAEARVLANRYLLQNIGNQVSAGEAVLIITPDKIRWKCPIYYAMLGKGAWQIGELVLDVESGNVIPNETSPTLEEMERRAEEWYHAADGRPL